jgi:hypothetical protein
MRVGWHGQGRRGCPSGDAWGCGLGRRGCSEGSGLATLQHSMVLPLVAKLQQQSAFGRAATVRGMRDNAMGCKAVGLSERWIQYLPTHRQAINQRVLAYPVISPGRVVLPFEQAHGHIGNRVLPQLGCTDTSGCGQCLAWPCPRSPLVPLQLLQVKSTWHAHCRQKFLLTAAFGPHRKGTLTRTEGDPR